MEIGIVSDTHLGTKRQPIPTSLQNALEGCQLILHCGDCTEPWVLDELELIAPVKAVLGNCDSSAFLGRSPSKRVVVCGGFRLGMIHGSGWEYRLESKVKTQFKNVDAVIFGHTHIPTV